MVNVFLFETFCPEKKKTKNKKQLLLFRCSVAPGNFPLERQEKPCSIFFLARFSRKNGTRTTRKVTVSHAIYRPFPHSCKQRHQVEARVDKLQ